MVITTHASNLKINPLEPLTDFQNRLDKYAENFSLNAENTYVKRYFISSNRDKFPELITYGINDVVQLLTALNISQIILLNDDILTSIDNFDDGLSIDGTIYDQLILTNPEDATRIDRSINPNALMRIYG